MIELFDDFRDILVELYKAGARFVVLGGHAVAFHGHGSVTTSANASLGSAAYVASLA